MKFVNINNNFSSGEWSPKMHSRMDTEQYRNSCEEITNFIVQMQGGAKFRAGTQKIDTSLFDTDVLDSLQYNIDKPQGVQQVPYTPVDSTKQGILFCLNYDGGNSCWGFYDTAGNCYEVTVLTGIYGQFTTFSLSGVTNLWNYTQLGDYLVLTNLLGQCTPLIFFYDTVSASYILQSLDNQNFLEPWKAHPYSPIYALDKNVTMSIPAITNTVGSTFNLTASAAYFTSSDVGRWIRLTNGSNAGGWVKITTYTSSTVVVCTIYKVLHTASAFTFGSSANSGSFWQISEWGTANGWPRTVTAFQGRLIFGGSKKYPDTIWGSRISSFWDFMEVPPADTVGIDGFASGAYTSNNSRPFTLTPNSPEPSVIRALSSAKTLTVHTEKAEIVAYGSNGALGPNNVTFESSTSFGSSVVRPVRVNNFSTFVQGNGKLRDIIYAFNEDQYKSSDLSFVADHLFVDRTVGGIMGMTRDIVELTKFEGESSVLLARLFGGALKYVTLDRDYQVNAWGSIELGHNGAGVKVVSVTSLTIDGIPTVFLILERIENGLPVFSFEKMVDAQSYRDPLAFTSVPLTESINLDNYLDCAEQLTGTDPDGDGRATTFQFADLTEDGTFSIVADGNYIGEFSADTGVIEFPTRYKIVVAGYKYEGVLTTNGVEAGGNFGPSLGQIKRIDKAVIRFLNTGNAQYGVAGEHLFTIPLRENGKGYFTGDKQLEFPAGYYKKAVVTVKQDKPYPCYIVSLALRGLTND